MMLFWQIPYGPSETDLNLKPCEYILFVKPG